MTTRRSLRAANTPGMHPMWRLAAVAGRDIDDLMGSEWPSQGAKVRSLEGFRGDALEAAGMLRQRLCVRLWQCGPHVAPGGRCPCTRWATLVATGNTGIEHAPMRPFDRTLGGLYLKAEAQAAAWEPLIEEARAAAVSAGA